MYLRILAATLVCIAAACFAWWLYLPVSPEAARARDLSGERWFALSLEARHLGYLRTTNYRDESGNWVFETEQRFAMNPYDPAATVTRRTFAKAPPHALVSAEHLQERRGFTEAVKIEPVAGGYRATREPNGTPSSLDWRYSLADYLAFELWLDSEQPGPGASRSVMSLDFDRLTPVRRAFDVVSRDANGYTIENAAPYSATRIRLDAQYAPVSIQIAGLFDLILTSREKALAPRSTLQAASYYIPIDRRLADHTRISRIVLGIDGPAEPRKLFPGAERIDGRWQLAREHDPISPAATDVDLRQATLQIPSTHPDILALARQATAGVYDDAERALALNRFVHRFLTYRPGRPPRSILALLEDRRGDCTEFADLLTTLARSLSLPARTVFGLAYADRAEPAFAYHAWNEIYVDNAWLTLDPTWGQERVDATHIPLPVDETAAMQLLTGSVQVQFSVLEVSHFSD